MACLLGMASKEVMVSAAPLIVLLYDRNSWPAHLVRHGGRRWGLYLGLAHMAAAGVAS